MQCGKAQDIQHFGETYRLHLQQSRLNQAVNQHKTCGKLSLPDFTALHHRKQSCSHRCVNLTM